MYPYISRDAYTIITPIQIQLFLVFIPEGDISSTELGKFKLENEIVMGLFLAPKCYYLKTKDERDIIKHKG